MLNAAVDQHKGTVVLFFSVCIFAIQRGLSQFRIWLVFQILRSLTDLFAELFRFRVVQLFASMTQSHCR